MWGASLEQSCACSRVMPKVFSGQYVGVKCADVQVGVGKKDFGEERL